MNILKNLEKQDVKMPVFFIGHGNPMNGILENDYTRGWKKAFENVPKPTAIVVVSAHWETRGTQITAMKKPRTIYDFYGFPPELFAAKYDVTGNPELAKEVAEKLKNRLIELDENWGLDHGSWTILKHLYAEADIPVLQLSLDYGKSAKEHYELAKELAFLREKGVLIIGSGNLVHNLRMADFRNSKKYDWAISADNKFKNLILSGEHDKLIKYESLGNDAALAIPSAEHFLPLLYVLALVNENETVEIFNDSIDLGSISMTSVKIG
ncbi:MAG TPA: 4,5-DOPA dioxygenase extradiol [Pyrinomonadaceae bacterium]|nr:4,5-DOPA dioxygenase extradiol [Pyrinomonadaceae bacterium]